MLGCGFIWGGVGLVGSTPPVCYIWMLALFINPLASFASQKRPNHGTLALSGKPSKNEMLALDSVLGNDSLFCKWLQENVWCICGQFWLLYFEFLMDCLWNLEFGWFWVRQYWFIFEQKFGL